MNHTDKRELPWILHCRCWTSFKCQRTADEHVAANPGHRLFATQAEYEWAALSMIDGGHGDR